MTFRTLTLAAGTLVASVAFASAAPLSAGMLTPTPLVDTGHDGAQVIEVRGGCGFGEHRGPFGGCRINNGPRGAIRRSMTGLPRGCPPAMHRGPYGRCHY